MNKITAPAEVPRPSEAGTLGAYVYVSPIGYQLEPNQPPCGKPINSNGPCALISTHRGPCVTRVALELQTGQQRTNEASVTVDEAKALLDEGARLQDAARSRTNEPVVGPRCIPGVASAIQCTACGAPIGRTCEEHAAQQRTGQAGTPGYTFPEPLHTQECLEYAAKTRKAYCIDKCSQARIERIRACYPLPHDEQRPDYPRIRTTDTEIIRRLWLRNYGWEPMPGADDEDVADVQKALDEARADERQACSETALPLPDMNTKKHGSMGLTDEQLAVACMNYGIDITCGDCACQFFTGAAGYGCDPTCKTVPKREPLTITVAEAPGDRCGRDEVDPDRERPCAVPGMPSVLVSDGSGGIRAVMIGTRYHDMLMVMKQRTGSPTTSFMLEKLIEAAHVRLEEHDAPVVNNTIIKVDGKTFHCPECGANVFQKHATRATCNGCGAAYVGEFTRSSVTGGTPP